MISITRSFPALKLRYDLSIGNHRIGEIMTKGQIIQQSKSLSPEDRLTFDRWLIGNAVVGSIMAVGLIAMAIAGSQSTPPHEVQVAGIEKAASDR